jgi:hypothetical protein
MRRSLAFGAVGLVGATGLGACAQLLGDDFEIVQSGSGGATSSSTGTAGDGGGGGTGATGGGGSGGTGGAPPPPPVLECDWELPNHRLVASHQQTPNVSWSEMYAVRRGPDSMRVFISSYAMSQVVEIWTVNSDLTAAMSSFPAGNLMEAKRLNFSAVAALYSDVVGGLPVLKLRVVNDGSANTSGYEEVIAQGFQNINANQGLNRALFVPLPGAQNPEVDFVVGYETTMNNVHVEAFGRFTGTPVAPVVVTPANAMLDYQASYPRALVHDTGRAYGFFGVFSMAGMREWIFDGTMAVGPPRILPPSGLTILQAGPGMPDATTNFLTYRIEQTTMELQLYTGQIAHAQLETFTPMDDFVTAATFPTEGDLPVSYGHFGWVGDLFAFVGFTPTNETQMRYYFIGVEGSERGLSNLPFTGLLAAGETRERIENVAVAPSNNDFSDQGGTLHVIWNEDHNISGGPSFDVLYYDRLVCTPVR